MRKDPWSRNVILTLGAAALFFGVHSAQAEEQLQADIELQTDIQPTTREVTGYTLDGFALFSGLSRKPSTLTFLNVGDVTFSVEETEVSGRPLLGGGFACGGGGTCTPAGEVYDLPLQIVIPPITITLDAPVPPLCGVIGGTLSAPTQVSVTSSEMIAFPVTPSGGPAAGTTVLAGTLFDTTTFPMTGPARRAIVRVCKQLQGVLHYKLALDGTQFPNPNNPLAYKWTISGNWFVDVTGKEDGSGLISNWRHRREENSQSGVLISATDPDVAPMRDVSVKMIVQEGKPTLYRAEFKGLPNPNATGGHQLTFKTRNPVSGETRNVAQKFPHLAYIALGQMMRKYGNPSLSMALPKTENGSTITWVADVGSMGQLELSWTFWE
jgi:hypothetical protein